MALVGGSGSGKSTVAKLVAGLYEPWAARSCSTAAAAQQIPRRVLDQLAGDGRPGHLPLRGHGAREPDPLGPTVPEADSSRRRKDAAIHDDIAARPGGYDAVVEEAGRNFSGGQRQRLEIARALVGNPTLLVLDEATSALDPMTEQAIDDNLRRRGCTCLIVAHRLEHHPRLRRDHRARRRQGRAARHPRRDGQGRRPLRHADPLRGVPEDRAGPRCWTGYERAATACR